MQRAMSSILACMALAAAVSTARAEVVDSSSGGFTLKRSLTVNAPPARAYDVFTRVSGWWDAGHTYTGRAAALSLDARPEGCFCEKIGPRSGVVHMTVLYADPGKVLRMTGGLGPLQAMAVSGVMTLEFKAKENRTEVAFTYAVGGHSPQGLEKLAPIVDQVLMHQLDRYERFANGGTP